MSDVIDNKADHRFELEVEGHLATEHYKLDGNVITFEHTDVPKELGGKGVGSKLVQGALDQVRAAGLKLIPQCPFVKAWIEKHPEYADLVKSYSERRLTERAAGLLKSTAYCPCFSISWSLRSQSCHSWSTPRITATAPRLVW
ncbi:putative GNAT family acetyltransferase [Bradyrhizobium japonicum]